MPLGSAIGSGLGVQNPYVLMLIKEICESYKLPMIVDAGVGTASDAAVYREKPRASRPHPDGRPRHRHDALAGRVGAPSATRRSAGC
jgi:hypothetical protein